MRESILAEQTHAFVREQSWQAAVLPFGATEPHNLHMPYGTDTFQVEAIAQRACERAYQAARASLCCRPFLTASTPIICVFPAAWRVQVTPTTLLHLLTDLVDSLERQGVRKLVLLNGHGGNELKPLTRELHHRSSVFLCVCDWFRMARDIYPGLFEAPGEHADEIETSLGLAFFPELLRPELADEGAAKPSRFDAINRGWISITRPWHLVSVNTGLGDPRPATAEKGRRLMDVLVERLGDFLIELAVAPMDEAFPY